MAREIKTTPFKSEVINRSGSIPEYKRIHITTEVIKAANLLAKHTKNPIIKEDGTLLYDNWHERSICSHLTPVCIALNQQTNFQSWTMRQKEEHKALPPKAFAINLQKNTEFELPKEVVKFLQDWVDALDTYTEKEMEVFERLKRNKLWEERHEFWNNTENIVIEPISFEAPYDITMLNT